MTSDSNLSSRITLLGGEMLTWSDLDRTKGTGPFASPLVVPVLTQLMNQSTKALIAGPHAPWLLERFAENVGSLDVVVRSWPDAHALNLRLNGKPVRIYCGAFEKLAVEENQYDVVMALDGIPRLFAADSVDLPWAETVAMLRRLVKPGGHLVLGVGNAMGLDQLLDADASVKPPADDKWPTSTDADVTPPPGLNAVKAVLAANELVVREHYAVFPRASKTSLMVHEHTLAGSEGDEVLSILASSAFANGMGDKPVLTDPRRLAREMVRHGMGMQLAPGWLFVTQVADPAGETATAAPEQTGLEAENEAIQSAARQAAEASGSVGFPDALITDNLEHPYWAVVLELGRDAEGSWHRDLIDVGRSTHVRAAGHLQREPAKLIGRVPGGTLLEERFLTACRHDDLNALRRLVRGYAEWLHDQAEFAAWKDPWSSDAAGVSERLVVPGGAVFATFENVMLDGDKHELLDASWSTTLQIPYEIALTRALRRFGYRVLAGGLRHPWPNGMSPNRLTVTLASMVGVTVTPHLLERSARLEVELEGQQRNNTEVGDQQLYFELQTMGEQPMGTEPGQPRGYREALATVGQLSTELSEAQNQIEWLDATVQLREDQLRRERKISSDIKNSMSFAIGNSLTTPFRAIFKMFRPVFRAMNPAAADRDRKK